MISNRSLNKNEKRLFDENPSHGRETLKYALKAMFEEKIRYDNNGEDGSDSNAFLHAYWSALLARNIDKDWAYRWTNAHENDPKMIYTQMDLFNNDLGINFAKKNNHLSNDELANAIENLIDSGEGKKVESGELKNSSKEKKRNLNIFESIIEKALSLVSKLIASSKNLRNGDGMTPLIFAANQGELESLKLIVGYSDLESVDEFGETALFHAARLKSIDVGVILLTNNANVNAITEKELSTPLMEAVAHRNVAMAKLLLEHGANINSVDRHGFSAYGLAVNEGVENDFSFLKPS